MLTQKLTGLENLPGDSVAIDIGGTKTRGLLVRAGEVVSDHSTGSANVQNVTRQAAAAAIAELFGALGSEDIRRVVVGSGGVDTQADQDALAALIAPHAPEAAITVMHDSALLLAAGRAVEGVAVIAGTGSAAWGRNARGRQARSGGWGYLLGDEGSGYWLGREAVRFVLHRMNQELPLDLLGETLLQACGLNDPATLIAHFHDPATGRRYWAQKSKVVVAAAEAGHEGARAMVLTAARDLANLAADVLGVLEIPGPVVLGSGLGQNVALLQQGFRDSLAERGFNDVRILDRDPVFGAVELLAREGAALG